MLRIIPAIPGNVSVKSNPLSAKSINSMYDIKAKPAAKPGILYTNNKNKIIIINPTIPA